MRDAAGFLLAAIWLANGLGAKVLGLVPRHRAIVARFFGTEAAGTVTRLVGVAEILMAVWILSGRERAACACAQGVVIVLMNSLEIWRARDLLLFPILMPAGNAGLLGVAWWWSRVG